MARRPRQRQGREVNTIEIKRNVIEQFLMDAKDYIRKNRNFARYSFFVLIGVIVIAVTVPVVIHLLNTRNEQRFEEIVGRLMKIKAPEEKDKEGLVIDKEETNKEDKEKEVKEKTDAVIADLNKFINSTYFGFTHNAAFYVLGNIYYDRKNWGEARKNLLLFADKEKKNVLAPLALLKAALALEEANDLKGAIEVYKKLDERYPDCAMADQIYYNYARACALSGDISNSRVYYNKVISTFPDSGYAQQAKKRLFMLGAR